MRRLPAALLAIALTALFGASPAAVAHAAPPSPTPENTAMIRGCIVAAAKAHRVAPALLVILLHVEGGALGAVSPNTNSTVDIGPMQVNNIWVPDIAAHWHTTAARAYAALRDNFCANLEAGAWILRQGMDDAHGSFWDGFGYYHSHNPEHKAVYLRQVLEHALALQAQARRDGATNRRPGPAAAPIALVPTKTISDRASRPPIALEN